MWVGGNFPSGAVGAQGSTPSNVLAGQFVMRLSSAGWSVELYPGLPGVKGIWCWASPWGLAHAKHMPLAPGLLLALRFEFVDVRVRVCVSSESGGQSLVHSEVPTKLLILQRWTILEIYILF